MDEGKNISRIEPKVLDEMINKGVAEDQFVRQINREVKGAVGQATGKVVDILSKPFSWMEKLNQKSAALAIFREKYKGYLSDTQTDIDTLSEEAHRKAFESSLISGSSIPQNPFAEGHTFQSLP